VPRNRLGYAAVIGGVVAAGLASRSPLAKHLPVFIATYAGDTLWALTVFLALGFVFPRARTVLLASVAIALSFGVEVSQLYHAEWIDAVRATRIGALALGFGFKWTDLLCYTVGCAIGAAGEILTGTTTSEGGE